MVPGDTIIYDHIDKNHGSSRQSWQWISIWDFICWGSNHEAKIEPNGMAQDFESSKPTTSDITSPIRSYFLILPKNFHQLRHQVLKHMVHILVQTTTDLLLQTVDICILISEVQRNRWAAIDAHVSHYWCSPLSPHEICRSYDWGLMRKMGPQ